MSEYAFLLDKAIADAQGWLEADAPLPDDET